ncbi:MAG: hypothetical protein L6R28_14605 [Planctomycetes bacterium]|nr:hypothetical protein [Planctomycetota bacterium]
MARAKPKKNAPHKVVGEAAAAFAHHAGETVGRTLRPLLPLLVLCGLYVGCAWLLWRPLDKDPQTRLCREALLAPMQHAEGTRSWLSAQELRKIAHLGLAVEGRSVFEPGLAADLAHAYEESPWIEKVHQVKLRYPAAIRIERIDLREPFAVAATETGPLFLDKAGHVLPLIDEPPANLAVLGGFHCRRLPAGATVAEPEAREALELLGTFNRVLGESSRAMEVSAVQLTSSEGWIVQTREGALAGPLVAWGAWDDAKRRAHEMPRHAKLEQLSARLTEHARVGLREIKLNKPGAPFVLISNP